MRNHPSLNDIQSNIIKDKIAYLSFHASDIKDVIHEFSIPGYEYLSVGFAEFLDRFKPIIPKKLPLILLISGKTFNRKEKDIIERSIWMHYGLYLSEAAKKLKKILIRMLIYLIFMVLSSLLLYLVASNSNEAITNYGYLLFWFFAYRFLTHLVLDCNPIYKDYLWYRQLASVKLIFSDDENQDFDISQLSKDTKKHKLEADRQTRKHLLENKVFKEDYGISLGCKIVDPQKVLNPSGAGNMEIISDDMADYLLSALPFIKQKVVTKLEIEAKSISDMDKSRLSAAIRNYLAFAITEKESEKKANKGTSFLFAVCLFAATLILSIWGHELNTAFHEFILVIFWFFADYLLEFILLTNISIYSAKKTLVKLANMEIIYKSAE